MQYMINTWLHKTKYVKLCYDTWQEQERPHIDKTLKPLVKVEELKYEVSTNWIVSVV